MKNKTLLYLFIGWCVLRLAEYYLLPDLITIILWIALSLGLLCILLIDLVILLDEIRSPAKHRIKRIPICLFFFILTCMHPYIDKIIERTDWEIFRHNRMMVVKKVKLNQFAATKRGAYKLPFFFPHYQIIEMKYG